MTVIVAAERVDILPEEPRPAHAMFGGSQFRLPLLS